MAESRQADYARFAGHASRAEVGIPAAQTLACSRSGRLTHPTVATAPLAEQLAADQMQQLCVHHRRNLARRDRLGHIVALHFAVTQIARDSIAALAKSPI